MKEKYQSEFSLRQYMLSRDFEIYYYKDLGLKKVAPHTHDYYEFYFFLAGNVSMKINGTGYPLKSGDILFIPPDTSHQLIVHGNEVPYRRFVFWISQAYYEYLLSLSKDFGYLVSYATATNTYIFHTDHISYNLTQSIILHLLEELHSDRFGRETQLHVCVYELLLHLNRIVYEKNHLKKEGKERSLYLNILNYIESHPEENLSLDQLAEVFYVSKYHIAHEFKNSLGISVHQYVTKKRLSLCRDALLENKNITEIYQKYGFGDYSSFYRAFKKEYGVSPKEFRDSRPLKYD